MQNTPLVEGEMFGHTLRNRFKIHDSIRTDKRFVGGFHKLRPKSETFVSGTHHLFLLLGVGNQTLYFDMYSVRFMVFLFSYGTINSFE